MTLNARFICSLMLDQACSSLLIADSARESISYSFFPNFSTCDFSLLVFDRLTADPSLRNMPQAQLNKFLFDFLRLMPHAALKTFENLIFLNFFCFLWCSKEENE